MVNSRLLMAIAYCAVMNGCTMGFDQSMMNNMNIISQYLDYFNLDALYKVCFPLQLILDQ